MKFDSHSIAIRLPAAIVALCVTVAAVMSYMGYTASREALLRAGEDRLEVVLRGRERSLQTWFRTIGEDLEAFSESEVVLHAIPQFRDAWDAHGAEAGADLKALYIDDNPHPEGKRTSSTTPATARPIPMPMRSFTDTSAASRT
jgi:methyl-accepting chemotaxis protein